MGKRGTARGTARDSVCVDNNGPREPHPVWGFKNIKGRGVGVGALMGEVWLSLVSQTLPQTGLAANFLIATTWWTNARNSGSGVSDFRYVATPSNCAKSRRFPTASHFRCLAGCCASEGMSQQSGYTGSAYSHIADCSVRAYAASSELV